MNAHYLYRFYDGAGQLLYVGLTARSARRFEEHAKSKDWWDDVRRIDLERYDDRDSGLEAERAAIHDENPLHNVQHGTADPKPSRHTTPGLRVSVDPGDLRDVIRTLRLSYAQTGRIFGVTRQAVSKWLVEGVPSKRATEVHDLAHKLDTLSAVLTETEIQMWVRRPMTVHGSVLDMAEQRGPVWLTGMLDLAMMPAA